MKNRHSMLIVSMISVALCMGAINLCWAESEGPQDGSPYDFDFGLRLFGADVGVGYHGLSLLTDARTTIWAYVGGGYQSENYYRDADGNFLSPGDLAADGSLYEHDPAFWRIEGAWRLGVDQGFAWNERTQTNLVEAFAFYRGRYDVNQNASGQLLHDSTILDKNGILLNTLQAGFAYDNLLSDKKHKTRSGITAETSVEWGPGFFLNTLIGSSDFVRFNGTFWGFLPIYDLAPDSPTNLLSVYLCEFFEIDYAIGIGEAVPLYVRQTFGGRDQRGGLGGAVRGVDGGAYDANLKSVNCLEVRANLPSIFWTNLVPGVVVFFDAGYFNQVGETGTDAASGFIYSTGAGIYLDLFDLANLAAYVEYRLDKVNADGDPWSLFAIEFGLHF